MKREGQGSPAWKPYCTEKKMFKTYGYVLKVPLTWNFMQDKYLLPFSFPGTSPLIYLIFHEANTSCFIWFTYCMFSFTYNIRHCLKKKRLPLSKDDGIIKCYRSVLLGTDWSTDQKIWIRSIIKEFYNFLLWDFVLLIFNWFSIFLQPKKLQQLKIYCQRKTQGLIK